MATAGVGAAALRAVALLRRYGLAVTTALLLTGTVGSGKTSAAEAVGDLLIAREIPNAVIDVDWLRRCWPSPPGDCFNGAITLRNLRGVTRTFVDAGAARVVLAGVIESCE